MSPAKQPAGSAARRSRIQEARDEKLRQLAEAVEGGSLVIRQATDEERVKYGISEQTPDPRKP